MAYQSFMRSNPAGSRFAMPQSGGTLAQLTVQPQHRVFSAPAAQIPNSFSGPASTTTSPGTMGPTGPTIPGGTPFPGPQQPQVAAMAPPASASPFAPGGGGTDTRSEWLRNTPGYQFDVDEMQRATEASAAAKGTLLSGGTLRELQDRAHGLASTNFGAEADRLARLTQLGQAGAQQLGNYGTGYSETNAGLAEVGAGNQIGLGNAQAGGTLAGVNAGNATGSAIANTVGGLNWDAATAGGGIDWHKLFGKKPAGYNPQGLSA